MPVLRGGVGMKYYSDISSPWELSKIAKSQPQRRWRIVSMLSSVFLDPAFCSFANEYFVVSEGESAGGLEQALLYTRVCSVWEQEEGHGLGLIPLVDRETPLQGRPISHHTLSLSLSGLGFKMAFLKILLQNDPILSHILSLKNLFENYRL